MWLESGVNMAVIQALIQLLAWELLYAADADLEKKRKQNTSWGFLFVCLFVCLNWNCIETVNQIRKKNPYDVECSL